MDRNTPEVSTGSSNAGSRILVVDDEAAICDILARWLSAEGYRCATASSASQAWRLLNSEPFSLLLTDITMPEKSGIDLLAMVKQQHPDVAVLMLTALDDQDTAVRTLEMGAYGYILKPFEKSEIVINVTNALRRRRIELDQLTHEHDLEKIIAEQTEAVRASSEEIVFRLIAAQENRPDETAPHIRRVSLFAAEIARRIGYSQEQQDMLRVAASLHDIGKIGVPTSILLKPGPLTPEEWETLKSHTTIGGRILGGTSVPLLKLAGDIALYHHERWDGTGYPCGLPWAMIPEAARIVAVADVYDALVHGRVYRPPVPEETTLKIMTVERDRQFDPGIFDAFIAGLPEMHRIRESMEDCQPSANADVSAVMVGGG